MYKGDKRDLVKIDSTDTDEQIAVASAYNLNRLGTSWPQLMRAMGIDNAKLHDKNEFVNDKLHDQNEFAIDSLEYIVNTPLGLKSPDDPWWWTRDNNQGLKYPVIVDYTHRPDINDGAYATQMVPYKGTEEEYFKYLDAVDKGAAVNPSEYDKECAKLYKEWQNDRDRIRRIFSR